MAWRARMFDLPAGWGAEETVAFYREESSAGRRRPGADRLARPPLPGRLPPTTFRWAVFHLIEETARHVGHMDITRELLDGSMGR